MKLLLPWVLILSMVTGAHCQQATTIFLVRHAEKADDTRDPELSMVGKARAHRLSELLAQVDLGAIYSTDYQRTQQTVAPVAENQRLQVQSYRPFDEEMVDDLQTHYAGQKVLVTGHSNTIPDLVNQLISQQVYEQLDDNDYSKIFVVTIGPDMVSHFILTY